MTHTTFSDMTRAIILTVHGSWAPDGVDAPHKVAITQHLPDLRGHPRHHLHAEDDVVEIC